MASNIVGHGLSRAQRTVRDPLRESDLLTYVLSHNLLPSLIPQDLFASLEPSSHFHTPARHGDPRIWTRLHTA